MTPQAMKSLRAASGLGRQQLAERLGKSPHTVKSYELGQRAIPDRVALRAAAIFDGLLKP